METAAARSVATTRSTVPAEARSPSIDTAARRSRFQGSLLPPTCLGEGGGIAAAERAPSARRPADGRHRAASRDPFAAAARADSRPRREARACVAPAPWPPRPCDPPSAARARHGTTPRRTQPARRPKRPSSSSSRSSGTTRLYLEPGPDRFSRDDVSRLAGGEASHCHAGPDLVAGAAAALRAVGAVRVAAHRGARRAGRRRDLFATADSRDTARAWSARRRRDTRRTRGSTRRCGSRCTSRRCSSGRASSI